MKININNHAYSYGESGSKLENKYNYFTEFIDDNIYKLLFCKELYIRENNYTDDSKFIALILLKWFKNGTIRLKENDKYKNIKDKYSIIIYKLVESENHEKELYDLIANINDSKIITIEDFSNFCIQNEYRISKIINQSRLYEIDTEVSRNKIIVYNQTIFKVFEKTIYEVNAEFKEIAEKLSGMNRYIKNYKKIKTTNPISESKYYDILMYSIILGISQTYITLLKKEEIIDSNLIEQIESIIEFAYINCKAPVNYVDP